VRVLARVNWTLPSTPEVQLPKIAGEQFTEFVEYYLSKHKERRIDLRHGLGTAELTASFNGSEKILCVTTFMMIILMCFNEKTELTFEVWIHKLEMVGDRILHAWFRNC